MTAPINMKGWKFHYLTVKFDDIANDHGEKMWYCKCKCGNFTTVRGADLRNGHTKSCGCWDREVQRKKWVDYRKVNGTKMDPRYAKGIYKVRVQR